MVTVEMRDGRVITYKDATHWQSYGNRITVYGKKLGDWERTYVGERRGRCLYKRKRSEKVISVATLYTSAVLRVEIGTYSSVKKAPKGFVPLGTATKS